MKKPKPPVVLRNGDDPLLEFTSITERYEALADTALASYQVQHRQSPMPLLVIVAAGIDAYRYAAQLPICSLIPTPVTRRDVPGSARSTRTTPASRSSAGP